MKLIAFVSFIFIYAISINIFADEAVDSSIVNMSKEDKLIYVVSSMLAGESVAESLILNMDEDDKQAFIDTHRLIFGSISIEESSDTTSTIGTNSNKPSHAEKKPSDSNSAYIEDKEVTHVAEGSCIPNKQPSAEQLEAYMEKLIKNSKAPELVKDKSISIPQVKTCSGVEFDGLPSSSANEDPTSVKYKYTGEKCTAWRVGFTQNPPDKFGGYLGKRTLWVWFSGDKKVAVGTLPDKCIM